MFRPGAVIAALALACGPARPAPAPPEPTPAEAAIDAAAEVAPGDLTGAGVTPRAYRLELAIDPNAIGYTGTIAIDVDVATRTSAIWLDARDLRLEWARLTVGAQVLELTPLVDAPDGRLGLILPRPIDPGRARLELAFGGDYRSDDGIFAQTYRAHSYVFSDFEPVDARRGFPCFDEPRWKTPWTVSLVVPDGMVALSNAPAARSRQLDRDLTRVEFEPTPPLPSYLVALAVGPFEVIEAEGGPVPVRIVAPSGRAAAAEQARAFAPELLEASRAFLDRPVPFAKIDIVAVPRFGGAMENPGLITVAADILLDGRGERGERHLALVLAHELAHLWFGDSVTLTDWRDLWINEGFASWMADEVLARWRPAWATRRDEVAARITAMRDDELPGSHPLRPDVLDSPRALFDLLTYQKSAAVLHMIEAWLGADRFVEALRGYLDRHAAGSASGADVIAALAPLDGDLDAVLAPLLDRAGVPHLDAELICDGDARLRLEVRDHAGAAAPWTVPACVRWRDGATTRRACTVVGAGTELALGDRCPSWVHPNADAAGYYRWTLRGSSLAKTIAGAGASDPERLDAALAVRGALGDDLREVAAALVAAIRTGVPPVVEAAIADYQLLLDQLAPRAARKAIAGHLRAALAPGLRRLGTAGAPGDSADDLRLRVLLLGAAGGLAGDRKVIAWARKTAGRWLADPSQRPASPELLEPALLVAAAHADADLAAELGRASEEAIDLRGEDAPLLARALGRLPSTRALAALERALTGALPPMSIFTLAAELLARADTAADAADALAQHGDWLAIALTFAPTCDPALVDRLGGAADDDAFTDALTRRRAEAARCAALAPHAAGAARAFKK